MSARAQLVVVRLAMLALLAMSGCDVVMGLKENKEALRPDGPPRDPNCPFVTEFPGTTIDGSIWKPTTMRPSITFAQMDQLEVKYEPDISVARTVSRLETRRQFDLSAGAVTARLVIAPSSRSTTTRLDLLDQGASAYAIEYTNVVSGHPIELLVNNAILATAPDLESHRYLRIRFADDQVFFERSDGTGDARVMGRAPVGVGARDLQVAFAGGTRGDVMDPGTAAWNQLVVDCR